MPACLTVSFYRTYQAGKKIGNGCFKGQPFAADRMSERNRSGMQCQIAIGIVPLAVFSVPHNGVSLFRQVHPYLVFAAGEQVDFQQAEPPGLFQDSILRVG